MLALTLFFLYASAALTVQAEINRKKKTFPVTDHRSERIVDGAYVTDPQMFPFMAFLEIDKGAGCSGALITESWVLTAAHCVKGVERIDVYLGTVNSNVRYNHYSVNHFEIHPYYEYKMDQFGGEHVLNDIALIRLSRNVTFSNTISTIKLATAYVNPKAHATSIGYGATFFNDKSNTQLKYANLQTVRNEVCANAYQSKTDGFICAMGSTGTICRGDSGGPLVQYNGREPFVVGVASSGVCDKNLPAQYTRISDYKAWIEQKIKGNLNNFNNYHGY